MTQLHNNVKIEIFYDVNVQKINDDKGLMTMADDKGWNDDDR